MYSHMMVGSNDLEKAKTFYDAVFTAIGGKPGITDPKGRLVYLHNGGIFLVTKPIDGEPACVSNGSTIGFAMDSPEQADAWHAAGAAAGGTEIEDPPGMRDMNGTKLYLAYLRDPDGHKLCALYRPD
ncbi:VOC family protein [Aurantiacibacter gilvus]|uniref:VOC family protein n=1 Tax=Aurantiacibacter gilvus TaxID=3139141 RepID=A0ABU9IHX5_9SPHN